MKLVLKSNDALTIKRMRSVYRRRVGHSRITIRYGNVYTMRYNPGRQPRTESQEKSWSLFKEANARVAADFANPARKAHWVRRQRQQSRYKTARGLARAYYMQVLRTQILHKRQDIAVSTRRAVSSLRVNTSHLATPHHTSSSVNSTFVQKNTTTISWTHHRNVHWWRTSLHTLQCTPPQ